jgi:hypothetical protein
VYAMEWHFIFKILLFYPYLVCLFSYAYFFLASGITVLAMCMPCFLHRCQSMFFLDVYLWFFLQSFK